MRGWVIASCVLAWASARADVDLFPRRVLQEAQRSDAFELPADSPWRSVERKAYGLFEPRLSQVTDESPATLLARQIARRREPAAAPPGRQHPDPAAADRDPVLTSRNREAQVGAAQAAYAEPAEWRRVELEAVVGADGALDRLRLVQGSGRPSLDAAAVESVRRAVGAVGQLGQRGGVRVRIRVEAGAAVEMPARAISDELRPRPVGGMVPLVRGRFGDGRKAQVTAPLQPVVRTRVTIVGIEGSR